MKGGIMAKYEETSMGAIFLNRVEEHGGKALVTFKNKDGVWEDISWNQMSEMVHKAGLFLISKGVQPGDKIALFAPNSYEWWVTDMAILSIGAVNVPIYATNSAKESEYIIDNSDSRMCFVGTRAHMEKILEVKGQLPNLGEIILFDDLDTPVPGVMTMEDAMKEGSRYEDKEELERRIRAINIDDVATIIYTSGTTGNPKGVMLTHKNFVSNVNQIYNVAPSFFDGEQVFLSFLPLSHSLERTVGYYAPIYLGKKVAFAEDISKLVENLKEIRPLYGERAQNL